MFSVIPKIQITRHGFVKELKLNLMEVDLLFWISNAHIPFEMILEHFFCHCNISVMKTWYQTVMLRLCPQLEIVTNVVKHRKKRRLTFISLNCQDFYVFNRSARWYIDRPSTYEEDSSFPTSEFPQVDRRNLGCRISGSKQKHWEHFSFCLQKQEFKHYYTYVIDCNRDISVICI